MIWITPLWFSDTTVFDLIFLWIQIGVWKKAKYKILDSVTTMDNDLFFWKLTISDTLYWKYKNYQKNINNISNTGSIHIYDMIFVIIYQYQPYLKPWSKPSQLICHISSSKEVIFNLLRTYLFFYSISQCISTHHHRNLISTTHFG